MTETELAFSRSAADERSGLAPLLFLHGLGSRGSDWESWTQHLQRDRPWLAPDLRGHGANPRETTPVRVEDHSDAVERTLDREFPQARPHLIGLSLGSMVALELAARRPDRIASVFAVSPVGDTRLNGAVARAIFGLRMSVLRRFGIGASAHLVARVSFSSKAARREAVTRLQALDATSYGSCLAGIPDWQVLDRASRMDMPITLVRPARDFFPRRASKRLAQALPQARWIELEGARHAAPLEVPERLLPLLIEHLERVEKSTPRAD